MTVGVGEGDPELGAVQHVGRSRRHLGVGDPVARRHQVELAGMDGREGSHTVAVVDLPGEEPAHRLQSGVRMRRHIHAGTLGHRVGSVVVDEAPRADQGPLFLRKRAAHGPRSRAAERHLARFEDLDALAVP